MADRPRRKEGGDNGSGRKRQKGLGGLSIPPQPRRVLSGGATPSDWNRRPTEESVAAVAEMLKEKYPFVIVPAGTRAYHAGRVRDALPHVPAYYGPDRRRAFNYLQSMSINPDPTIEPSVEDLSTVIVADTVRDSVFLDLRERYIAIEYEGYYDDDKMMGKGGLAERITAVAYRALGGKEKGALWIKEFGMTPGQLDGYLAVVFGRMGVSGWLADEPMEGSISATTEYMSEMMVTDPTLMQYIESLTQEKVRSFRRVQIAGAEFPGTFRTAPGFGGNPGTSTGDVEFYEEVMERLGDEESGSDEGAEELEVSAWAMVGGKSALQLAGQGFLDLSDELYRSNVGMQAGMQFAYTIIKRNNGEELRPVEKAGYERRLADAFGRMFPDDPPPPSFVPRNKYEVPTDEIDSFEKGIVWVNPARNETWADLATASSVLVSPQPEEAEFSELEVLPAEILQEIVYGNNVLSPKDILSLALTSRQMLSLTLGDPYAVGRIRARLPLSELVAHADWESLQRALADKVTSPQEVLDSMMILDLDPKELEGWAGAVNEALARGAAFSLLPDHLQHSGVLELEWIVKVMGGGDAEEAYVRGLKSYRAGDLDGDDATMDAAVLLVHASLIKGAQPSQAGVFTIIKARAAETLRLMTEVRPKLFRSSLFPNFVASAVRTGDIDLIDVIFSVPGFDPNMPVSFGPGLSEPNVLFGLVSRMGGCDDYTKQRLLYTRLLAVVDHTTLDKFGCTVLGIAMVYGRGAFVDAFVDLGLAADQDQIVAVGRSSDQFEREAFLKSLIESGTFDVNHRDAEGKSYIDRALFWGARNVVEYLLSLPGIEVPDVFPTYHEHNAGFESVERVRDNRQLFHKWKAQHEGDAES